MSGAPVFIDRSQFPENVRRDLVQSLRERTINHKFLYDSYRQAAKWMALHDAYSPARNDPSCGAMYDSIFESLLHHDSGSSLHLISLGCGGGQKEAKLLQRLRDGNRRASYTASDVSLPLVITARSAALPFLEKHQCRSVVCDLATAENLPEAVDGFRSDQARIVTVFGVIPNFAPRLLISRIAPLLRSNDLLLISANLSSDPNYEAGVRAVQPQYDNDLTRDWLVSFLLELGFDRGDGEISFEIQMDVEGLRRITAHFCLNRSRDLKIFDDQFRFTEGERIQLFFSYRHTVRTMQSLMEQFGFVIIDQRTNLAGDEGVFLCRSRNGQTN